MKFSRTMGAMLPAFALATLMAVGTGAYAQDRTPGVVELPPLLQLKLDGLVEREDTVTAPNEGTTIGPDVTIINLSGVSNYTDGVSDSGPSACPAGYEGGNGMCHGFSIGTDSCNIGSFPVDWCDSQSGCRNDTDEFHEIRATTSDHSVISQNLYRLKDGRFEQIGMSFLKHGFLSLNSSNSDCVGASGGGACIQPPADGQQLGIGCTDFYGSGLNGSRPMGRRSDVQVAGADHPPTGAGGETNDNYDQRIVVREADLNPALNAGALYFVEGQYVVRDDARNNNGLNNASHRLATVNGSNFSVSLTGPTVRERSAIYAWQQVDPAVEIKNADKDTFFLGEPADPPATGETYDNYTVTERFELARKLSSNTDGGPLGYHYEFALHNLNSTTSANSFSVDFGGPVSIGAAGFTDIDHHSGEPFDTTDWTIDIDQANGIITWSTDEFAANPNANALRWGTTFSFWFDSDSTPEDASHFIGTFLDDGVLSVRLAANPLEVFTDGFESGDTNEWSTVEN